MFAGASVILVFAVSVWKVAIFTEVKLFASITQKTINVIVWRQWND
jgi:hypothetical protein